MASARKSGSSARSSFSAVVAAVVALALLAACKREESGGAGPGAGDGDGDAELRVAREVGAGWSGEDQWEEAHASLEVVAKSKSATPQDLVNLACVKLHRFSDDAPKAAAEIEAARVLCQQAVAKDGRCAAAHYVLGLIAFEKDLKPAVAKEHFAKAVEFAPDDLPARIRYAEALQEVGETSAAIEQYEVVRQRGIEYAGAYYKPAIYKLSRLLRARKQGDDPKVAADLTKEHTQLGKEGAPEAQQDDLRYGNLARVRVPPPAARPGVAPKSAPAVRFTAAGPPLLAEAGAIVSLDAGDLNGDGCDDLVALGANGLWCALHDEKGGKGGFVAREIQGAKGRITGTRVAIVHVENEGGPSLLVFGPAGAMLLSPDAERLFRDESGQLPALPAVNDLQAVDYDHEGHLDLLVATPSGVKLLRNDGIPTDQATLERQGPIHWTDVTTATGMPSIACDWVAIEDFDADQDVDFLVGGAGTPPLLLSNLRKGRFEIEPSDKSGLSPALHAKPLLVDLDHDGRVDVVEPGAPPAWQRNKGNGTFDAPQPLPSLAPLFGRGATLADLDWNGEQDLVGVAADGQVAVRFGSLTAAQAPEITLGGKPVAGAAPLLDDVDNDGALDLLTVAETGVELRRGSVAGGHALALLLKGVKDNRPAIGAVLEVRAGDHYERRLALSRRQIFGLGARTGADVARITWPNGVVQNLVKPASNVTDAPCVVTGAVAPVATRVAVLQKEGLIGSCPFLYAWNGTKYDFVSDVLGTTPLGLPMKEGIYVPPDHDELVRVTAEQLKAADGEYRLQFTEELREVTYLDRAELWVVDHPADVEVHPEERFSFPPFPPQKIHTVKGALPPVKAVDQSGRDWTAALAQVDGVHAVPFQPVDSRYLGLVTSHVLELTLPDAVKSAKKVRLLMTGWLFWTDASVNIAADHTGRFDFVPPILSVPDGHGGAGSKVGADGKESWRECGPPVGFPAGKTKTMVLDVSDLLNRDDPRLRIFSTIRLYWDAIRVAVDDDDAPITVTKLEPRRANLWSRGFSAPVDDARKDQPDRFDWNALEHEPRWNQHPGQLTRYGEVAPLLGAIDDRFVILSAGDAIDLRFDAATTPPKPGMGRTYLLFLDGWAKDADPNTMFSQSVEPLPFHGMSGYPYAASEHYPDDDAHADYRAEWNTRPGRRLIKSLVVPPAALGGQ